MLSATQIGMIGGMPMPADWLLKGPTWSGGDAFTLTPRLDPFRQRRDRKKLRIANFTVADRFCGNLGAFRHQQYVAGGFGDQPARRHPRPRNRDRLP